MIPSVIFSRDRIEQDVGRFIPIERVAVRIHAFESAVEEIVGRAASDGRLALEIVPDLVILFIFACRGAVDLRLPVVRGPDTDRPAFLVERIAGDQIIRRIVQIIRAAAPDFRVTVIVGKPDLLSRTG